jgi:SAM-dependent methyltransferase
MKENTPIQLADLRRTEFTGVQHFFRSGVHVLEIGGGTGYQASLIASTGASIDSIDVAEPLPGVEIHFPVRTYEGKALPFPDDYFDVVFSSNVLEHIPDLRTTLSEVRRVMKSDGRAIHILPTPAWRTWTSLSHYIHISRRLVELVSGRRHSQKSAPPARAGKPVRARGTWNAIKRVLRDGPHGEYPSAISELWYFSRRRWLKLFQETGFELVEDRPSGIFYTGYGTFPSISIERRRELAGILGSATRVFIMRKAS